jgi:hypothetical protein
MTVSDDDLALVAKSFPFFRELSLVCCDGFSTVGLAVVAERCRYVALALNFSIVAHELNLSGLRYPDEYFTSFPRFGRVSYYAIRAFVQS